MKADPSRRSLALRKLLRRFVDVCNAIDYAHTRGVLHRDIKPANIIVGKYGETLVVNWGLAKALGRAEPGLPIGRADADAVVGQRLGRDAARLGAGDAGLHEPRAGRAATSTGSARGPTSTAWARPSIACSPASRRSRATTSARCSASRPARAISRRPRSVDPSIDQALEAVCLKAMATKPEDRYARAGRWPTTSSDGRPTSRSRPGASRWSQAGAVVDATPHRRSRPPARPCSMALVGHGGRLGRPGPGQRRAEDGPTTPSPPPMQRVVEANSELREANEKSPGPTPSSRPPTSASASGSTWPWTRSSSSTARSARICC